MTKTDLASIKDDYDKLKAAILSAAPFISSLLRRVRIVLTDKVPTAGVDNNGIMGINPEWWSKLDYSEKSWVLAHELFHVAFRDIPRCSSRHPMGWNVVADLRY